MMADSSLDEYIQKKGIGMRMKPLKSNSVQPFKRKNVVSVANEHVFQAKKPFDAREKLRTFQGTSKTSEDARVKLVSKKLTVTGRINDASSQVLDARAKLNARQTKPVVEINLQQNCDEALEGNFQLASIKKTLIKGVESPTNRGWSLVKTVTNDVPKIQQNTVTNVAGRKVARLDSGITREVDRIQIEEKEPSQTFVSPIQSYRVVVSNLGPNVTYDDVEELFSSCGPLRKVRMPKPGSAEVFYVNVESAREAVDEYHNRELDDRPMSVSVSLLQDVAKVNETRPLRSKKQLSAMKQSLEVDLNVLSQALFRVSADQASNAVDFTVHL